MLNLVGKKAKQAPLLEDNAEEQEMLEAAVEVVAEMQLTAEELKVSYPSLHHLRQPHAASSPFYMVSVTCCHLTRIYTAPAAMRQEQACMCVGARARVRYRGQVSHSSYSH